MLYGQFPVGGDCIELLLVNGKQIFDCYLLNFVWFLLGMTAPQAAGVIHSDFEKGFIRAETVNFILENCYNDISPRLI